MINKDNAAKNYKQYEYISRYESFPYYFDDLNNRYYYGLTAQLNQDAPYALYKVKVGDSYDSIASDYYGCALYYWIICHFNGIFDALQDPIPGTQLKLPSLNSIRFELR